MLRYNLQRLFNDQSSREVTLSHPVAMTNLQNFLELRHHPVINQEMRGMGYVQQTKNFTAVHINALNRIRIEQAEPAHIPQPVPPSESSHCSRRSPTPSEPSDGSLTSWLRMRPIKVSRSQVTWPSKGPC